MNCLCVGVSQVAQWERIRLPMKETVETRVQSLGWEDPLEKEMAAHSSILAEESHGQRSLVGYSPWVRKKVRQDLSLGATII